MVSPVLSWPRKKNPNNKKKETADRRLGYRAGARVVHEFGHGADHENNPCQAWLDAGPKTSTPAYQTRAEETVITNQEQKAAQRFGLLPAGQVTRTDHGGTLKPAKHWWPGESDKSPRERNKKEKIPNSSGRSGNSEQGPVQIQIGDKIQTYGGNK